jgi:hypothetical protein
LPVNTLFFHPFILQLCGYKIATAPISNPNSNPYFPSKRAEPKQGLLLTQILTQPNLNLNPNSNSNPYFPSKRAEAKQGSLLIQIQIILTQPNLNPNPNPVHNGSNNGVSKTYKVKLK